jgi:hypothetical protein
VLYQPGTSSANYIYIISDLVQNGAICSAFTSTTAPVIPDQISWDFDEPKPIQGNYIFSMIGAGGVAKNASVGGDYCTILIEFNSV